MKSLHDRHKTQSLKVKIFYVGGFFLIVFIVVPLMSPSVGNVFRNMFNPLWKLENNFIQGVHSVGSYFSSKQKLESENTLLKNQLSEIQTRLVDRDILFRENLDLKNIVDRKPEGNFVLATVLVKPSRSLYDTLIIDIGSNAGLEIGQIVYAFGAVPIGTISQVGSKTATVTLYSTSGQKIVGRLENTKIDVELVGRGGGNFELKLPRDIILESGMQVLFPDLMPAVIATVTKSITDPRDPVQTFLLTSPVNINQLHWVQVEK